MGTICNINKHKEEILSLMGGDLPQITVSDETVEDSSNFALEEHLEDFLVANWQSTELARNYEIVSEDGEIIGQQYPTDTGPIDILAMHKNNKEFLVVELKKERASDSVIG